jgi:NAD(P)-dependent dehydrogenase (short-subunit alcohol dehydrogenase family)
LQQIGYFLASRFLLPRLRENRSARIVNVASTFASDVDMNDLQFQTRPFESMKAYAQSKACDRMLTWALARRLEGSGVTANAMAPGLIVDTGLYRHASPEVTARLRQRGAGRTPSDGADTAIWLASSPEVEGVTGKFFENRKEIPCSFRNREVEEQLWSVCERLTE